MVPILKKQIQTYVTIEHAPLFENVRFVVIIDSEARKQNLVLVRGHSPREFLLSSAILEAAFLNKGPECRVVEVVDVACAA